MTADLVHHQQDARQCHADDDDEHDELDKADAALFRLPCACRFVNTFTHGTAFKRGQQAVHFGPALFCQNRILLPHLYEKIPHLLGLRQTAKHHFFRNGFVHTGFGISHSGLPPA